jgi:drug/metabolite transporter (DMT)-like permease
MSGDVAAAILFAAFLHASWNALIKRDRDAATATAGIAGAAAVIALLLLPFFPAPAPASWPFIAASSVVQLAYYLLIAKIYRHADLGLAYPVMRGTAPLLVTGLNALLFGESLSAMGYLGVAGISGGVLLIASARRAGTQAGATVVRALFIALVIALYTLIDGLGVRRSGAPVAYTLWVFLLTGLAVMGWTVARRGHGLFQSLRRAPATAAIGGGCTLLSYGIALWAMTRAPVSAVAALRETAILFAILISVFALKEAWTWRRGAAVLLLAAGAVAIRLS